jgi:hypothetical protein
MSETPQAQRTLRDYARHDEDCTTNQCGQCGRWRAKCEGVFAPRSCSCGLDALLSPPPSSPTVEQARAALDQAVNDIEANSRGLSGKDLERNYEAAKDAFAAAVRAAAVSDARRELGALRQAVEAKWFNGLTASDMLDLIDARLAQLPEE